MAIQPSLSPSCCSTPLKPVEARTKISIIGFARRRNASPAASCFDISCTEVGINQGYAGNIMRKEVPLADGRWQMLRYIFNKVRLGTKGFDVPSLECSIIWQPKYLLKVAASPLQRVSISRTSSQPLLFHKSLFI